MSRSDLKVMLNILAKCNVHLTQKQGKKLYKQYVSNCEEDRLKKSLTSSVRTRFFDQDKAVNYGLCRLDWTNQDTTAEEVEQWFDKSYGRHIYSAYDCTGQWFTAGVHAHRNPCGLWTIIETQLIDW